MTLPRGRGESSRGSRRALVTGASAGLGKAVAGALVEAGHPVTLVARREAGLQQARSDLLRAVPEAQVDVIAADLGDSEAVHRLCVEQVASPDGHPDILVHVTGGPPLYEPGTEESDVFKAYLDSHTFSLWSLAKEFIPRMQNRGWGRVISVMSRTVAEPRADNPLSAAVRLPAWAILKSYASSGKFPDVTINAVLPGLFDTERFRDVCVSLAEREEVPVKAVQKRLLSAVPAARLGRPEEVGALCEFLASESAGYVSGQKITIDGGATGML